MTRIRGHHTMSAIAEIFCKACKHDKHVKTNAMVSIKPLNIETSYEYIEVHSFFAIKLKKVVVLRDPAALC